MDYKKLGSTYVLKLEVGEDITTCLSKLASEENIAAASVSGLGAINYLEAGVYYPQTKKYQSNIFQGNFEIVSLTGTISQMNYSPYLHLHISVANEEGQVFGGHLNKAIVSATAEILIRVLDGELNRHYDSIIGLNLFDLKG